MKAFLRAFSLGGLRLLWLSYLCNSAWATSNSTWLGSGPTTPPPPYALQDPTVHPGSPAYSGPSPSEVASNVSVLTHLLDQSTSHSTLDVEPWNQQFFDRHTWVSRVRKPRERVTLEKKLIRKYRRRNGMKRTCDHVRWKKSCVCGIPPDTLEEILRSLGQNPSAHVANTTDKEGAASGSMNVQAFRADPDDVLLDLSSSSSGPPPWPNSSQPILAESKPVSPDTAPFTSESSAAPGEDAGLCVPASVRQPETWPIIQDQLVAEVKGIYAGLVMVEKKRIEIDEKPTREPSRLSDKEWQALTVPNRTLLHEHHDSFLASQHLSASAEFRGLTAWNAMLTRMWRHGLRSFLELLRHRLPGSREHMLEFIRLTYAMIRPLLGAEPSFSHEWVEILGDLSRYRLAIDGNDVDDREIWSGIAQQWYIQTDHRSLNTSRSEEHHTVFHRPTITRRPQQNGPERQLPEDLSMRELHCAQDCFPPDFFQGQDTGEDEKMLDMVFDPVAGSSSRHMVLQNARYDANRCSDANLQDMLDLSQMAVLPRPDIVQQLAHYSEALVSMTPFQNATDSVTHLFDPFREEGASIGSQFAVAESASATLVPEVGTGKLEALHSPSSASVFDWQAGNYALTESETAPDIQYNPLDQIDEDTSIPDVNFDEFLHPEIPLFSPLNPLFDPTMTFSLDAEDPDSNTSAGDLFLVQWPDWNADFDVNMVHEIVESSQSEDLYSKPPVGTEHNPDEDVLTQSYAPDLCESDGKDDQAIENRESTEWMYTEDRPSLQSDGKPTRSSSAALNLGYSNLPRYSNVQQEGEVNTIHLGDARKRSRIAFCVLLVSSQRVSRNTSGVKRQKGCSFQTFQIMLLLLLAMCYLISGPK
jgi:hypothetical protein